MIYTVRVYRRHVQPLKVSYCHTFKDFGLSETVKLFSCFSSQYDNNTLYFIAAVIIKSK